MAKSKNTIESRIDYSILLPVLILLLVGMVSILSRQILIIQRISFMSCLSNYYGFFLVQYLLLLSCYVIQSFFGRSLPGFIFLAWDLWFCLFVFIHFFGCLDRSKKLGQYWISHPFSTIRIYEDILHPFSFEIGVRAKQGKEVTELQDDWLLLFQYVAVTLPVLGLLVLQGDMGTALVFLAILAV